MKKLILLCIVCMAAISTYAQNDNLIKLQIPQSYKIKDRIILVNNSNCTILRGVVVLADTTEQVVLGTCNIVAPDTKITLASFDKNGLKKLRGRTIGIKIKGVKKLMIVDETVSTTSGYAGGFYNRSSASADVKADDINNLHNDETVTYDFSASLSEANHDLYINIYDNNNGEGVLDF